MTASVHISVHAVDRFLEKIEPLTGRTFTPSQVRNILYHLFQYAKANPSDATERKRYIVWYTATAEVRIKLVLIVCNKQLRTVYPYNKTD